MTDRHFIIRCFLWCALLMTGGGCGTSVQRGGSEQLLLSDSVDRAVDQLDLSPLADRRVFLDTKFMPPVKDNSFINSEYITSAIRQKMTTSGCIIVTDTAAADYILEPRVGAMGADSLEVTYGIPSSGGVGQAATALAGAPSLMAIPEISFGKRKANVAISKVVVYAYHRETGVPVWQSGHAIARSDVQDSWLFGVGPVSRGSSYEGYRFAGKRLQLPFSSSGSAKTPKPLTVADSYHYVHPAVLEKQLAESRAAKEKSPDSTTVQPASHTSNGTASGVQNPTTNSEPGPPAPSVTPPPAGSQGAASTPSDDATSEAPASLESTKPASPTEGSESPSAAGPFSPGTFRNYDGASSGVTAPPPWTGNTGTGRKQAPNRSPK
jgi:hypothetical protein